MDAPLSRARLLLKQELAESLPRAATLASGVTVTLGSRFSEMSPSELSELFVIVCYFRSVLQPLIDQDWLRAKDASTTLSDSPGKLSSETRTAQMKSELHELDFLRDEIVAASPKELKAFDMRASKLLRALVSFVKAAASIRFREMLTESMRLIDVRAREQDLFPHGAFSEAMYRAYDQLDDILGIDYKLDHDMITDPLQNERLYEGAGIGVQTSYSSILLALDRAKVAQGARVLDLGSGYGRVGFVLGLLRPDISFTGFEYVDHRVQDSIAVAKRAGLSRIEFATEDLSTFDLPPADVYYMYDPFSRETYGKVISQLIEFGRTGEVTIITKGRANTWVRDALASEGWLLDETCDSGTVCLFRSRPNVSV